MPELQIFRVDASTVSAQRFDARLTVNAVAPIFAEHFPDYPIVPGACIVGFVINCIARMKGAHVGTFTIPRVAFLEPIIPQQELCLEIKKKPGTQSPDDNYHFRLHHEASNYCRGVIALEGEKA
jgi:3-hydroxymyristoyl/3-hydroxydecanoyl-(acyl carrier protein) dehydratase